MKEHYFNKASLIGGWYIDPTICDNIINFYNSHQGLVKRGVVKDHHTIDTNIKDSWDLCINQATDDLPFGDYKLSLQECVNEYSKKYPDINDLPEFTLVEPYNVQKYPVGGGFKIAHFENYSLHDNYRCLVFMTYLNDVPDGGTEFLNQELVTPAKKGLTLLWPAYFTHPHRGVVSNTREKYIATGWLGYPHLYNKDK